MNRTAAAVDTPIGRAGSIVWAAAARGGALGLAAGVAARIAMRLMFLLNPSTRGVVVGEIFPVGGFTAQGTGVILIQGVVLGGLAGAVYGLARPALPRSRLASGVVFDIWLVTTTLGWLVRGETRDFDLFGPYPVAVGLFALIFAGFGLVLAILLPRFTASSEHRASRLRVATSWTLLAVAATPGLIQLLTESLRRL